ncbi:MSMEG_0569 family flavin-dependent oxidoreductase [Rhodococcus sp. BP-349]|uniref:MSMEG_0569 family flavin-dependent oxidoreductase n=1 Tax=unclassified Rhodococcus (in: high G+C Gram-positive bacteria) TaxID=192944 RepID=UPI001C9B6E63|nr:MULTISPECIES: MSMEG_0569 family flavin-dependent oxidoreductase [unclassified Rhodococcus (in: high G+C Gram-positive bacteria)]MBY6539339.1 MSMEG_0569 family flavin-dependent oxidoreductase [Rhodococcus sp. BP-363]MBY6544333.1 MSMEG_0569 family flavin-dependent oxidoreductase [Rhodococcus sp. BP-369]MBY6563563.1 MSMEG_0569 family flavin-dependent oxidoreductase [Rhodococcus sp. BP-370]MBY6577855.1 MSMEG_0569 family flavin-dependent oxidoreductase [Rhodococcus sp. BP-364]MBY6587156.1 MSMEG_
MTEHHTVIVIGAGQAGLSMSWHLTRRGVDHVVLERDTIAHEWLDGRWDNFTLVTPNWQCVLPGYAYDGDDPDGFMTRDLVYDFVRRYADSFGAPVREHVAVLSVQQAPGGGYAVSTSAGAMTADQVVVAVGGYHVPSIPRLAERVPETITQIHSSRYRSAAALPPGGVLVVGTGQSGAQIAEDLHLEGRQVHLVTGSAPRVARFYRGRDCVAWLQDMGVYDVSISEHAGGLFKRESTNHYVTGRDGGRDIDLRAFALDGMRLYGRLTDVGSDGVLRFAPTLEQSLDAADAVSEGIKNDIDAYIARAGLDAPVEERYTPVWRPESEAAELDLEAAGVTSVVWAVGFRRDYRWLKVGVFDGEGHPAHTRGVTAAEGLYFLGLPWQNTWGSGRFAAVARDAEYLAEQMSPAVGARVPAAV